MVSSLSSIDSLIGGKNDEEINDLVFGTTYNLSGN